jgi:hypothetical protein
MKLDEPFKSAHAEYVRLAILAMRIAQNEADLIDWWKAEQSNRAKYNLTPTQWPGLDLKQAFDEKRRNLKGT